MNFSFVDPWHLFLPREPGHVIGFSGSGGKTSLLLAVARLYGQERIPVILTTTTRTEPLAGLPAADVSDEAAVASLADEPVFCLHTGTDQEGKWRGLGPDAVDRLGESHPGRVVLVETDGAGKMPLKYYRPDEPVWPQRTSLAISVMGLSALEERAAEAVFRFGRQEFPALHEVTGETRWNWDHYHALLTGEGGYLDRVPADVPVVLALAGMATLADSIGLFGFMGQAMAHPRVRLALFCETEGEEPSFRTVCRTEEEDDAEDADGPAGGAR